DLAVVLPGAGEHVGEAAAVDRQRLPGGQRGAGSQPADAGRAHAARSPGPGTDPDAPTPACQEYRVRAACGRARNTTPMRGATGRAVLGMPCSWVVWLAWLITSRLPGSRSMPIARPPDLAR